jgi:hypothetical protein
MTLAQMKSAQTPADREIAASDEIEAEAAAQMLAR